MVAALVELIGRLDLSVVARVTIVLALGLGTMSLANRARASVRHLMMVATFGTVLLLPLLSSSVPAVTIQVPPVAAQRVASDTLLSFALVFQTVWALGATLLLLRLGIDLRRLRVLRRGGLPWLAGNRVATTLARASGVRRSADVLLHQGVSAPLTFGLWRSTILLPIDASEWSSADLERALVHELEHLRRGDWLSQLVARVVCACYWFHPLAWMAWTRLRLEAERACDDAVVERAECTEYAEQLISLARRMSTSRALPSLAMADRSDLSARVLALLDGSQRRGRAGYRTVASVAGVAAVTLLVVTSVHAIAVTKALPMLPKAAATPQSSVSDRSARAEVTTPYRGAPNVTQRIAGPNSGRRRPHLTVDSGFQKNDGAMETQRSGAAIYRSVKGGSTAEVTITRSASAAASATSSGSSSSSSHNNIP